MSVKSNPNTSQKYIFDGGFIFFQANYIIPYALQNVFLTRPKSKFFSLKYGITRSLNGPE